jgi:hypothetical protein
MAKFVKELFVSKLDPIELADDERLLQVFDNEFELLIFLSLSLHASDHAFIKPVEYFDDESPHKYAY